MADRTKRPNPTRDEYAEAAAVREALRAFQRSSDVVTARHDLTSRTYQLLLMIKTARNAGSRAGLAELEERLQLGRSTITELVLRTEERGYVRRELDPEHRGAIRVALTPRGERRLASACAELGDQRRALIDVLAKLKPRAAA
ncbi:MAG: MarR family winged helix-turn-helix transcriptional regulator [Gaiellaceae bacterium]